MISKVMMTALGALVLGAAPALADGARVYPYASSANYCPAGLQPVSINGVICCGTPNQSVSYQSMKAQPAARKLRARRAAPTSRVICPVGEKGCYTE